MRTFNTQQDRARLAAAYTLIQMGANLRPSKFVIGPHGPVTAAGVKS